MQADQYAGKRTSVQARTPGLAEGISHSGRSR